MHAHTEKFNVNVAGGCGDDRGTFIVSSAGERKKNLLFLQITPAQLYSQESYLHIGICFVSHVFRYRFSSSAAYACLC